MEQVSGPVIAVGLVLSAVFVPCAFISGITGQFFRQFALTIAVSTVISAFNSLTLSPALTALLLQSQGNKETSEARRPDPLPRLAFALAGGWLGWHFLTSVARGLGTSTVAPCHPVVGAFSLSGRRRRRLDHRPALNRLLGAFFRLFNWGFLRATNGYTGQSAACCASACSSWSFTAACSV